MDANKKTKRPSEARCAECGYSRQEIAIIADIENIKDPICCEVEDSRFIELRVSRALRGSQMYQEARHV